MATQSQVIQVAFYSHELVGWFWWLVREWKVQSRGVHRDFHGLACDSLANETFSCEKHLEIFFQIFRLEVFWRLTLATGWRLVSVAKIACFVKIKQFFFFFNNKTLFQFSLNLLWLFIVFFVWTSLNDTVFTHKLSLISLFLHQSLRKGMDFVSFLMCSSYLALYLLDCVVFVILLYT